MECRKFPLRARFRAKTAFTLVELLVAAAVFLVIVAVVLQFTDQTSKIWRSATAKIQAFQEARAGFDAMTRMVSQATLNTYFDYYDSNNRARSSITGNANLANFEPKTYDRYSDLHFVSGQAKTLLAGSNPAITTQTQAVFFQAPEGYSVDFTSLNNALNACGYFLQFDSGEASVPKFVSDTPGYKPRYRYRMMEMRQPAENLSVYHNPTAPNDWFQKNAATNSRPIAENVIALALLPKLPDRLDDPNKAGKGVSLAPNYNYNSRIPLNASTDPSWSGAFPSFPPDRFQAHPTDGSTVNASRHHQLPPTIRMVMIVIDEASAARLQGDSSTVPPAIDFSGTDLFTDATKLEEDIQKVEAVCNAIPGNITGNTQKLNYRVFSSDLIMRQSKWSNK